jgi:TPR repeat protein
MVPTFKSQTLITYLYSMNPPDSRGLLLFYHPIITVCYACGTGLSVNRSKATKYFKLSADQGNPYGQFAYGPRAQYGKEMPIDLAEAAKFDTHSADQNMLDA